MADIGRHELSSIEDDRRQIRDIIECWAVWRDAGEWERFATLWHDDVWMMTTWSQSPARDFIARSRAAFANGLEVLHMLGGSTIEVVGNRAIAQTKTEILQRARVHDVLVDVECKARFLDALERRDGRWGLVFRQPVYEMDRMTPVNPADTLELDQAILDGFPKGYCHLAYLQVHQGMNVYRDLPGTRGEGIEVVKALMADWLGGAPVNIFFKAEHDDVLAKV